MCRGVKDSGFALCYPCNRHRDQSGGVLADVVVPVSYSPRTSQHHHNLRAYKASPPSKQAQWNLLALLLFFLRTHLPCIATAIGGYPTHLATVPSTRGRNGPHPLSTLIGARLNLPTLQSRVNPHYGPDERQFHRDWFDVGIQAQAQPARVLLIDDTWTSGSRVQSLAYGLKRAGATKVAVVVLGRHVNPDHRPSRPLLDAVDGVIFDPSRCALDDWPGQQQRLP